MSSDQTHRLVMMANQIATAFDGQRGDAVGDTLAHLRAFWSPPMRKEILRHLGTGGEGLSPTARAAVAELAAARPLTAPRARQGEVDIGSPAQTRSKPLKIDPSHPIQVTPPEPGRV